MNEQFLCMAAIPISVSTAFLLYLALTLVTLLTLWFIQNLRMQGKPVQLAAKELYVCEYCQTAYLEERTKAVSQCPQCSSYNKQNQFEAGA